MEELRKYLSPDEVDAVVYHANCSDGFAGAYSFWKLSNTMNQDSRRIDFIPYSHTNDESVVRNNIYPRITNKNVVYIDVCPTSNTIKDMLVKLPNKAIVLDHHESSYKSIEDGLGEEFANRCYIDMSHSGAILGHMFCFPDTEPPMFLICIEDRDLWAWKYSEISVPFIDYFYTFVPYDFQEYQKFENVEYFNQIVEEGKVCTKYKTERVNDVSKRAVDKTIILDDKSYNIKIINTSENISDVGNVLSKQMCTHNNKPCDFVILWYYDHKIDKFVFSLRSDKDRPEATNVRMIAQLFEGGGHPNAAGFSIKSDNVIFKVIYDKFISLHDEDFKQSNPNPKSKTYTSLYEINYQNVFVTLGMLSLTYMCYKYFN